MKKPKCKLPDICTASHLIGKTVLALRYSGMENEMREFINMIKKKDINIDFATIYELASNYVEFYE